MKNNQDNQTGTQEKTYQIPMIVTAETIRDFGIDPSKVKRQLINNRWCLVVMVEVTEEQYKAYMASQSAEDKRQDREGRCRIKGKSGRLIRCPECNHCSECEHYAEVTRAENRPVSLSVLMDSGIEPSEGSHEDDVINYLLRKRSLPS